ncbi:DUF6207 family protein [Streptomyces sp. NPDC002755]
MNRLREEPCGARVRGGRRGFEEVHLSEPGLIIVDVAGVDDEAVFVFQAATVETWGTSIGRHPVAQRQQRNLAAPSSEPYIATSRIRDH